MQTDLFATPDPGTIRADPGARIKSGYSSSGHPGARMDPGGARAHPGAMPREERSPDPAATRANIQKLKRQIEGLGAEVMAQRDIAAAAKKAAEGPKAAFRSAHEAGVEWCQEAGMPPYGDPLLSAEFRRHIAARDQASRILAPFKRAEDDAARTLKAMVAELRYLNAELERYERLLG